MSLCAAPSAGSASAGLRVAGGGGARVAESAQARGCRRRLQTRLRRSFAFVRRRPFGVGTAHVAYVGHVAPASVWRTRTTTATSSSTSRRNCRQPRGFTLWNVQGASFKIFSTEDRTNVRSTSSAPPFAAGVDGNGRAAAGVCAAGACGAGGAPASPAPASPGGVPSEDAPRFTKRGPGRTARVSVGRSARRTLGRRRRRVTPVFRACGRASGEGPVARDAQRSRGRSARRSFSSHAETGAGAGPRVPGGGFRLSRQGGPSIDSYDSSPRTSSPSPLQNDPRRHETMSIVASSRGRRDRGRARGRRARDDPTPRPRPRPSRLAPIAPRHRADDASGRARCGETRTRRARDVLGRPCLRDRRRRHGRRGEHARRSLRAREHYSVFCSRPWVWRICFICGRPATDAGGEPIWFFEEQKSSSYRARAEAAL